MAAWRRLIFSIPRDLEDELIASLHEAGTLGVESSEGRHAAWFPMDRDAGDVLESLRRLLGEGAASLRLLTAEEVPDGFWHERWMEGLSPLEAGERFLIVPGPATPPHPDPRRHLIRLTPGRAFGTGEHPTTRMCLSLLESAIRPGDSLLDVGTGSGILAIGARRLGASPVTAIDIDPVAIETARRNAVINDVDDLLLVASSLEGIGAARFDLVAANLSGATLVRQMRRISGLTGREAIVSGLLRDEEGEVARAAASAGLAVARRREEGEWIALALRKEEA